MHRASGSAAVALLLIFTACTGDGDGNGGAPPADDGDATGTTTAAVGVAPTSTLRTDAIMEESLHCDPLDERDCLLPWPNDGFTVPDETTATGRRLAIQDETAPTNEDGVYIDVTDQNRADGFSPGSVILTFVPGIDLEQTGVAPSTDIGSSLRDDAPIVVLDTDTGQRLAYWAELDAQAPEGDQVLMIHPAASLPEGHHIVVGLRNLRDPTGQLIERTSAFQAALDNNPEPLNRARAMRELIQALVDDGVDRESLFVAWDFTVASAESLAGRALSMREQAYTELGDGAPAFTVDQQSESGNVRIIEGTYEVPNFLSGDGSPDNTLLLDNAGTPVRNDEQPVYRARFHCFVPLAADADVPMVVYGHGLLGDRTEVDGLQYLAQIGLAGACATDEIGMSSDDIGNVVEILGDLSQFPEQADRMVQGLLNQQFLGRLLNSDEGFASAPEFQSDDGSALFTVGATQFVGNSQGGILGGAASAVSTEWDRVVLGVPGINYSLLLTRSSDWPEFQSIVDQAYTDPVERVIALQLVQLLWDRGENSGYAQHLTDDPYPGIEAKRVLLVQAFGDHQVANVSTEVLARTLGATVYEPALAAGRSTDVDPQWNIAAADFGSPTNAILVIWDYGTPAPPTVNLPPFEPEYGEDPHGAGSSEPLVLQQAFEFLFAGDLLDVCAGQPCQSEVLTG